jgi:lysozyme family protein
MLVLDQNLRISNQSCFDDCQLHNDRGQEGDRIIQKIGNNKPRYQPVGDSTRVPWYVIGVIHSMEAGCSFKHHLHNGDPLNARTIHVPAGRPPTRRGRLLAGNPPFTWETSAIDAIKLEGFDHWADWSIPGICYKLERYNGIGYRAHHVNSPYLWGGSNQYTRGKYVQDGVFSIIAVSRQIGAMVLLKLMNGKGMIDL